MENSSVAFSTVAVEALAECPKCFHLHEHTLRDTHTYVHRRTTYTFSTSLFLYNAAALPSAPARARRLEERAETRPTLTAPPTLAPVTGRQQFLLFTTVSIDKRKKNYPLLPTVILRSHNKTVV